MTGLRTDAILTFYKREPFTHFQQKVLHMGDKGFFKIAFGVLWRLRKTYKL